jgi:hypothetical protein
MWGLGLAWGRDIEGKWDTRASRYPLECVLNADLQVADVGQ